MALTRSQFNQHSIAVAQRGRVASSADFMKRKAGNQMCRFLIDRFPSFVDPDLEEDDLVGRAISVLKKFDYVFTTENLDRQAAMISEAMGISPIVERRRVAGESRAELEESDDSILSRNAADLELYSRCSVALETDGHNPSHSHNPLGFDAEAARAARQAIVDRPVSEGTPDYYQDIGRALNASLRSAAAVEWLERANEAGIDPVPVNQPDALLDILTLKAARLAKRQPEAVKEKIQQAQIRWRRQTARKAAASQADPAEKPRSPKAGAVKTGAQKAKAAKTGPAKTGEKKAGEKRARTRKAVSAKATQATVE